MNKQQNKKELTEGLRPNDLEDLVYPKLEIDSFRSKMGEDKDVCVLTFQAKDRYPAKDMMEFIEKGYPFVLDADVSAGENSDGEYSIFVEIERSSKLAEQIMELTYGVTKLTGIDDWKFKYYKSKDFIDLTTENLKSKVPSSSKIYEQALQKYRTDEVKSFFSKTLMDDLVLEGDLITIKKPFGVEIQLKLVQEGDNNLIEGMEEGPAADDAAMSEVFWLTKVMGDYNINKFGDRFIFTNGEKSMVLQRI
jgi:hypothetical protein